MFNQEWIYTAVIITIITLTGMTTAILTVLSAMGDLTYTNYRGKHFLAKRGKWVVALALLILAFSVLQFVIGNSKEQFTSKQDEIKDSLHTKQLIKQISEGIDTNSKKLFTNLSEALAKQGLRFDTLSLAIVKLRDSAKTIIVNNAMDDPFSLVENDGISIKDSANDKQILIKIKSTNSAARVKYVDYFLETTSVDGVVLKTLKYRLINNGVLIPLNMIVQKEIGLNGYPDKLSLIRIALIGEYSNSKKTKRIKLRELYVYKASTGKTSFETGSTKDEFFTKYKSIAEGRIN